MTNEAVRAKLEEIVAFNEIVRQHVTSLLEELGPVSAPASLNKLSTAQIAKLRRTRLKKIVQQQLKNDAKTKSTI